MHKKCLFLSSKKVFIITNILVILFMIEEPPSEEIVSNCRYENSRGSVESLNKNTFINKLVLYC